MADSTPSGPSADRNLLFGILALQMDFISRDALIKAMNAWVLEKAKLLGQLLIDQGALRPDAHAVLEALVQKHLELHDNEQTYFDFLSCQTGIDNGPEAGTLEVVYNLYSIPYEHKFCLKENWIDERESWTFQGIRYSVRRRFRH